MIFETIIRAGITSSIDLSVEWSSTYEYLFAEQRERTNRRTFAASTAIRQERRSKWKFTRQIPG